MHDFGPLGQSCSARNRGWSATAKRRIEMLKETTRKFPLGEVVYTASLRVALLNEYRL